MKKILINTLIILSFSVNVAVVSMLVWNYYHKKKATHEEDLLTWHGRPLQRVLRDELGLEDDKIAQLRKIIWNRRGDILKQRQKIRELRDDLRILLSAQDTNREALNTTLEKLNCEQSRLNAIHIERILEIKDTLPHEVQKKWRLLLQRGLLEEDSGHGRRRGKRQEP
jgi:Spy/CpxP family protein refolding chaperone